MQNLTSLCPVDDSDIRLHIMYLLFFQCSFVGVGHTLCFGFKSGISADSDCCFHEQNITCLFISFVGNIPFVYTALGM